MNRHLPGFCLVVLAIGASALHAADIGTAFTYQGNLENGSGPVSDTCDFRIGLWDADVAGNQVGTSPQTASMVDVVGGVFTVSLDYGAGAIDGTARWLEIEVQCPGDAGFTLLSPRVELTAAPHATRAVSGVGPPNALEIDSANGRVGIGTAAPAQPLHVVGTMLSENPGTSPTGSTVRFGGPSSDPGVVIQRGDGVGGVARQWDIVVEHTNDLEIRDNTAGSVERMVIDTTGRVGIGTITPGEQLTVAGTVHSTTGGFKFPDGSTQTTAAMGGGGGNTLDEAYDQGGSGAGRIITADSGPIEIQGNDGLLVAGAIQSGNSITIDGTSGMERIVSSDALEIHTSTGRILRVEPETADVDDDFVAPNWVAGWTQNSVTAGVVGATISGGGASDDGFPFPNIVTDDLGTIGGGYGNQAGDNIISTSNARAATVGGGSWNIAAGHKSTVGGGHNNQATQAHSTVSGGLGNLASNSSSTVSGGSNNDANGAASTVSGGGSNTASGGSSSIPGGQQNLAGGAYSLAAGRRAKIRDAAASGDSDGDEGTFIWGDSTDSDFTSTGPNQFLIRAGGGVGINTNAPAEALDVAGNIHASGTLISGSSITIDGTSGSERIISSDALELHTSSGRIFRLTPQAIDSTGQWVAPNIIGGWNGNTASLGVVGATISGGGADRIGIPIDANHVLDDFGTVAGGLANIAGDGLGTTSDASVATVSGGIFNQARGYSSTVGGGYQNTADSDYATVGGGLHNLAQAAYATIAGGGPSVTGDPTGTRNRVLDDYGTVGGGGNNQAGDGAGTSSDRRYATVAGGENNVASGLRSTVSGGGTNVASGPSSVVGGGGSNEASGSASVVAGGSSNTASAQYATVPGGFSNVAGGSWSFAAGRRANANHQGSFVWGDSINADVSSSADSQFTARTTGGARFFSNAALTTGVQLAAGGGSWSSISDRNVKRNIEPVSPRAILERLTQVPLATWNYVSQDESIRHIGPMAQDFHAAFAVGEDQRYITGIDADGVALAAIQGLHEIVQEKDCEIDELKARLTRLEALLNASPSTEKGNVR